MFNSFSIGMVFEYYSKMSGRAKHCSFKLSSWLVISLAVITLSCNQQQARGKYEFQYYPSVNMYFDVAQQQYIYSLDSARTWNTLKGTTEEKAASLGTPATVYSDEKEIWKLNEAHRQQYNGTIFNVAGNSSVAGNLDEPVAERKVQKKAVRKSAPAVKERKGLGKFLQKVFGKKKKE